MRTHRLRTALLAMPFILSAIGASPAAAVTLNLRDVPVGDPDRAAIAFLNSHDVIYGSPDGTFRPDAGITRGEILKIALEGAGLGAKAFTTAGTQVYSDVPSSHTLGGYITFAAGAGYISGYGDGTFRPDASVTRAEAAKIVANILQAPAGTSTDYTDLGASSLAPYMGRLAAANWFRPTPPLYNPNIPATRREIARMTYRALVATNASPERIYGDNQAEPAAIVSDWSIHRDGVVPYDLPAGWSAVELTIEEEGIDVDVVAAGLSDEADPIFALMRFPLDSIDQLMELGIDGSESGAAMPDFTPRAFNVGSDGRTHQVMTGAIPGEDTVMMLWFTDSGIYAGVYDSAAAPGMQGLFERFIQHAVEATTD